jgi:hypothetical protein
MGKWIIPFRSKFKVTGHPFWRFAEDRYCALNINPIFIKFSVHANYGQVIKLTNNKIM